jgi:gas vesicle protein GvpN
VGYRLARPVVLIHGDDQMGTADLVGKESGFKRNYSRDQFIHNVVKVEEESKPLWVGRALTEACEKGYTVVYDEFTRSRPEANNVLLSVLEEGILPLRGMHILVHADFRIILTSNPAEYAGVHSVQDALLDRMVTNHLEGFGPETEVAIAHARSGISVHEVKRIVALVRAFRQEALKTGIPSVRASIMIARILKVRGGHTHAGDPVFTQACRDVLFSEIRRAAQEPIADAQLEQSLQHLIQEPCSTPIQQDAAMPRSTNLEPTSDSVIDELLMDKEVQALLLSKIREKGLSGRLVSHRGSEAQGETIPGRTP